MADFGRIQWYVMPEPPVSRVLQPGEFNGMSSQNCVSHYRVLPLGEFTVMIPEPHATLQGAATWRIQSHVIPEPRGTLQGRPTATWWIHCHDPSATCLNKNICSARHNTHTSPGNLHILVVTQSKSNHLRRRYITQPTIVVGIFTFFTLTFDLSTVKCSKAIERSFRNILWQTDRLLARGQILLKAWGLILNKYSQKS